MRDRFLSFVFRKAWPNQSLDRLLRAATLEDIATAAVAWRQFEAEADFDRLTPGEMRLIGLAAKRVASFAPDSPMLGRIAGIERANWSRSQLAIGAAAEGLRVLASASIDMLVIKGAARIASSDPAARGRMLNDVDIVVRSGDMTPAFDLLTREGWQPAGSGTALYHRTFLEKAVGINLVRGRFGNLDLHNSPFRPPYTSTANKTAIWTRASPSKLGYVPVWVPSATDVVTIAIAHGALDAHKSSDWLADIAAAIDSGVDWNLFETLVKDCRLQAPATLALRYVHDRLQRPVPASLLERLGEATARRPLALLASLSEMRPKSRRIGPFWIVRALAKQSRLLRGRAARSRSKTVLPSPVFGRVARSAGPLVLKQSLPVSDRRPGQTWNGTIDITMLVALPAASRRVDFEVNTEARHLARLRAVVLNRGPRERMLRFQVPIQLTPDEEPPVLVAAASRSFNSDASAQMTDRYGVVPFRIVKLRSRRRLPLARD